MTNSHMRTTCIYSLYTAHQACTSSGFNKTANMISMPKCAPIHSTYTTDIYYYLLYRRIPQLKNPCKCHRMSMEWDQHLWAQHHKLGHAFVHMWLYNQKHENMMFPVLQPNRSFPSLLLAGSAHAPYPTKWETWVHIVQCWPQPTPNYLTRQQKYSHTSDNAQHVTAEV